MTRSKNQRNKEKFYENLKTIFVTIFVMFVTISLCILGSLNAQIEQIKASADEAKSTQTTRSQADMVYSMYMSKQREEKKNLEGSSLIIPYSTYVTDANKPMYNGELPKRGTLAGSVDYLGKYATLYDVAEDGSLGAKIGTFRFTDVLQGGDNSIANGDKIAVWCDSEQSSAIFKKAHSDRVYMHIEK